MINELIRVALKAKVGGLTIEFDEQCDVSDFPKIAAQLSHEVGKVLLALLNGSQENR